MKKLFKEFKAFALTGNIMDLAVAVILGGAVGRMVSALVDSIIMPLIGILLGGADFSGLSIPFGNTAIKYGLFIQAVIEFLVIAFCIFMMVKGLSALDAKRKKLLHEEEKAKEAEEAKKPTTEQLLADILTELQKKDENR